MHERRRIQNAKIVRLIGREVPPCPHDGARFVLRALHPFRPARLEVHPNRIVRAVHFEICLNRNVREVVLGLAKRGSNRFGDAHNLEGPPVDQHLAPNGVHIREQLRRQVIPDHRHRRAALIVAFGNVPPIARRLEVNVHHIGRDSANAGVVKALRAYADSCAGALFHAHAQRQLHVVAQRFVIGPGHFLVAAFRSDQLLHVRNERKARQQEYVRAEISHAVGDVLIHSGNQRNHYDERGNRQDNAQQHQEGTHLVLAHGVQRHAHRFAKQHSALQHAPLHADTLSLLILRSGKRHCFALPP